MAIRKNIMPKGSAFVGSTIGNNPGLSRISRTNLGNERVSNMVHSERPAEQLVGLREVHEKAMRDEPIVARATALFASSADSEVKAASALVLGRVGGKEVIPALLGGLREERTVVIRACIEALRDLAYKMPLEFPPAQKVAETYLPKSRSESGNVNAMILNEFTKFTEELRIRRDSALKASRFALMRRLLKTKPSKP